MSEKYELNEVMERLQSMWGLLHIVSETFDFEPVKGHIYTITSPENDSFKLVIHPEGYHLNWCDQEYSVRMDETYMKFGDKVMNDTNPYLPAFIALAEILYYYENFVIEDKFEDESVTHEVYLDELKTVIKTLQLAENHGIDLTSLII